LQLLAGLFAFAQVVYRRWGVAMSLRAQIGGFLRRETDPADRLLVAVSGGADSMGLLALLANELHWPPSSLVAAHVQHGVRPQREQDADWALIQSLAKACGISAVSTSIDTPMLARTERLSLEVAARRLRYRELEALAEAQNCRWILTGHTADDSAETVLMRLRSGAPWYECTGIPPIRGQILRPLLSVSRAELRVWLKTNAVPFREDETNRDPRFVRNRLRAQLIHNAGFWTDMRMRQTAHAGEDVRSGLDGLRRLAQVLPRREIPAGFPRRIGLAIDEIFRYFNELNFIPVEAAWADLAGRSQGRLSSRHRQQINAFLQGRSPCARLPLPNEISLLRAGARVWLYSESSIDAARRVGEGRWLFPAGGLLTIARGTTAVPRLNCMALRVTILEHNLWVRPWQPGERLQMRGRPVKKIAELLAEQGVDPAARPHVLVLADQAGPLLIFGGAVAERALPVPDEPEIIWIGWEAHDATGAVHAL
jgi:tRNA(Ile)-lysidine synthetase-like protein